MVSCWPSEGRSLVKAWPEVSSTQTCRKSQPRPRLWVPGPRHSECEDAQYEMRQHNVIEKNIVETIRTRPMLLASST